MPVCRYEYLTRTSEALIRVAMFHLVVRRLVRLTCFSTPSLQAIMEILTGVAALAIGAVVADARARSVLPHV
jgi:hypothetical protein